VVISVKQQMNWDCPEPLCTEGSKNMRLSK
jgi:hypothetical protein